MKGRRVKPKCKDEGVVGMELEGQGTVRGPGSMKDPPRDQFQVCKLIGMDPCSSSLMLSWERGQEWARQMHILSL